MSTSSPWAFSTNLGFDPGTAWQERRGRSRVRSDMAASLGVDLVSQRNCSSRTDDLPMRRNGN